MTEHDEKQEELDGYRFSVLVWEIQDANIISYQEDNDQKRWGREQKFSVYTKERAYIESEYLKSIGLEQSWDYMVEHCLLQHKTSPNILWSTPQNKLWIEKKITILFQNVFSFSLDLTSNLVFMDCLVHSPWLFRVKFKLTPKCRNKNTIGHDEKKEELDG